jgi:hypothetical protein
VRAAAHPDVAAAARLLAGLAGRDEPRGPELDQVLYGWYLAMTPLPHRTGTPGPADVDLRGALDAVHADATRFVGGWRASSVGRSGEVLAVPRGEADDRRRLLTRGDYVVPGRAGLPAREGDPLVVRAAWTWIDDEHAFWYTRRGVWPPPGSAHLVRTYLDVAPVDAPRVIGAVTRLLADHRDVSYQLKTTVLRDHGGRADAVVLYLGDRDAVALADPLRTLVAGLADVLRPARPRFTEPLVDGIEGAGQASAGLDGESFGQVVCDVLARGWEALGPADRGDEPAVQAALVGALAAAGLDPAHPAHRGAS